MDNNWQQELFAAAVLTFEELCFLVPDESTGGELSAKVLCSTRVSFNGPISGDICVSADEDFLPKLVSHIVEGTDVDKAIFLDGLGEVATIIAGTVLTKIGGTDAVFSIDAPKTIPYSTKKVGYTALLEFEGQKVSVIMRVD